MNNTIKVDIDDLRAYATIAIRNGTMIEFIDLALDWAEKANDEIVRLNTEIKRLKDDKHHP